MSNQKLKISHNKKIILSLTISAIIVFLSLNLIMDLYLNIYDPDWRGIIQNKEVREDYRLFIIGASSVYSLNSSHISEILLKNEFEYEVFNLADMSDTPSHRLKSIDHLISLKPDMVVYGIQISDFEKNILKEEKTVTLEKIIAKNPKEIFIENFDDPFGKNWIPKLPTSPKEKMILTMKYVIRGPEYIHNPFINYIETDIATKQKLESYSSNIQFNGIDKSSKNKEIIALKEIIKKLQQNNIKIIIFSVPVSDVVLKKISVEEQEYFKKLIIQTTKEFGINSEFLHDKYADLSIWKDPYHVAINQNVTIYSDDVTQIILEKLS